jgi:hypothetical protein
VVKVYELVVGEERFGKMVYNLVEGGTWGRSCREEGLGMKGVSFDDIVSCRRVVAVHADREYRWVPC